MLIRQLFDQDTYTFTYLVADEDSGDAALIDPVLSQVDRDLTLLSELGLRLTHVLDTHVHADHVTGAGELRACTGARVVASPRGAECADTKVADGDVVRVGSLRIQVLATPGHTDDSLSFALPGHVFTGDALFVRGTGRTDFQNGNAEQLFDSIRDKLFSLPDETIVWPGHDYKGHQSSTIGEEKRHNPRLAGRSKQEFVQIMARLGLPAPKYLAVAVPANRECGLGQELQPGADLGFTEVLAERASELSRMPGAVVLDVREPHEFHGELGHLPGAINVPRGELSQTTIELSFDTPILVVCRSGRRSRGVCEVLARRGFRQVMNVEGGMLALRATTRGAA